MILSDFSKYIVSESSLFLVIIILLLSVVVYSMFRSEISHARTSDGPPKRAFQEITTVVKPVDIF